MAKANDRDAESLSSNHSSYRKNNQRIETAELSTEKRNETDAIVRQSTPRWRFSVQL